MATYKVIQDIEAEDKLVGPLSFRQFIYALIGVFLYYLCFICITKGAAFLLIVLLPPALFCTFFAFPFGGDQPTEVWALAKLRFYFKPRKRIWNQSGVKELVTITVPKKIEVQLTDGLSQMEVKSRLRALADTIDSRGWVIKNVAGNAYVRPGMGVQQGGSDRLLSIENMPQQVPDFEEGTDLMEQSSPLSQHLNTMIQDSTNKHRQRLLDNMNGQRAAMAAAQPAPTQQWFQPPAAAAPIAAQPVDVSPAEEAAMSADLKRRLAQQSQNNLHQLQPQQTTDDVASTDQQPVGQAPQPSVTPQPDPAILNLAKRDDLNVSTLAREASKQKGLDEGGEVVISLH